MKKIISIIALFSLINGCTINIPNPSIIQDSNNRETSIVSEDNHSLNTSDSHNYINTEETKTVYVKPSTAPVYIPVAVQTPYPVYTPVPAQTPYPVYTPVPVQTPYTVYTPVPIINYPVVVPEIKNETFSGTCKWVDGYDGSVSNGDTGRGKTNWQAHYDYVNVSNGRDSVPYFIESRLKLLNNCLTKKAYGHLYADISVLIATSGISNLNWIDGYDGSVTNGDTGRGKTTWQDHFDYVDLSNARDSVPYWIKSRLELINKSTNKALYSVLYADISLLIAKYGLGIKN